MKDVKVGGTTSERKILELEGSCGVLGYSILSKTKEEEVYELYHV